jgi:tetratricopeptide (TPR) repeat protein
MPVNNRRTLTSLNPSANPAPLVRVGAAASALVILALALPVKLPSSGGGSSSEECLTIADHPLTGADAISRLEQCATIVPDDVELLADLGAAYEAAGRSADAERIYLQILTLDDTYADIHVRLARLLLRRRESGAARLHLERALQIQPNRQAIATLIEETTTGGER